MNLMKSIDFLLENAGPVIQYRLRKEILNDLTKEEAENLLAQIYQTPYFKLLLSYVKPSGYIGSGMHSWDNWRGVKLHETPLQDGETAARLLAYYGIPKSHPVVANFVAVMRDEDKLREEFSYIPPEVVRFANRHIGTSSGFSLMLLIYALQAMLGYGDDNETQHFQDISLKGFARILEISSLSEIAKTRTSKSKYNYPYIEAGEYFPCAYTLSGLAYTQRWRTPEKVRMLADSLNHINAIMKPDNMMHIKIGNHYYAPCFALNRPIKPFRCDYIDNIAYRRTLTEIAMLGVGERVGVIRESAANVQEAIDANGILRMRFDLPHNKRYSPKSIEYPTAYADVRLEADYRQKYALECDLTFWAVQFLHLVKGSG